MIRRHGRENPCRICGGHPDLPRGEGRRCFGFVSSDACHCTREELAGNLRQTRARTFAHRLAGECPCGVRHDGGETRPPIAACRAPRDDDRGKAALVRRIWAGATDIDPTIVATYLSARGLRGPFPRSLRFAVLRHRPSGRLLPAMVAAVQSPAGHLAAVHRTFLRHDGSGKAPVEPCRMMLGRTAGGAVRLAPASEELAVAEGIETALSVMQATRLGAWAALSASGLARLELPPVVRRVVIVADGDPPGLAATERAAARWWREGRDVRVVYPPAGLDANDLLRAGGLAA